MLYDFGPRLLKLRKDKNLTQQMVVERAKGFDPNLRLSDSVSPEQVQLLMDLTAYIRTKKRRSQGHKNAPKPTTEETELITRLIAEILY